MTGHDEHAARLQADVRGAWKALVEAGFGLANAVSGGTTGAPLKDAEDLLRGATAPFAQARRALEELVRPLPRRRPGRRSAKGPVPELEQVLATAWAELVMAAFALRNAVNADAEQDELDRLGAALASAALAHDDAQQGMVDALRPRPRGTRRRK